MVQAFLMLVLLQLAGEALVIVLRVPVPGMVIGLLLLLGVLALRARLLGAARAVPAGMGEVAQTLHAHLGLLFIPAGVGILAHLDLVVAEGPAILIAVLVSTVIGIAAGAAIAARRTAPRALLAGDRP